MSRSWACGLARMAALPAVWYELVTRFGKLFSLVAGQPHRVGEYRGRLFQKRYHVRQAAREILSGERVNNLEAIALRRVRNPRNRAYEWSGPNSNEPNSIKQVTTMRFSAIRVLAIAFFLTTSARAGLILTAGSQLILAQGGTNAFGNLSGEIRTFGSDVINGFPSANSASAIAVAASATLNFSYTQSGDFAFLSQSISLFQEGVDLGMAEHRFTTQFTALNDLNFSFTANFNGLGTVGDPRYSVFLTDLTTLGNVFADNSLDPLDLTPVENHTGTLIAGHTYSFSGQSRLYAGNPGSRVPASATGNYLFTTSPITAVPEPSSMMLFALATLCLVFVRRQRSRQCAPVSSLA